MIARVVRYAYSQARVRAMRGELLTPEDWHFLLTMKGLVDCLRYLRGTHYAAVLSPISLSNPDTGVVARALYADLFFDYGRVLRAVPAGTARFVRSLLIRFEAENVKAVLGGLFQVKPEAEVRACLFELGSLSSLPIDAMFEAVRIPEAVERLRETPFYTPLLHAIPQFQAQGRLFPLEIAADQSVFDAIRTGLNHLAGFDRRNAGTLAGKLTDVTNLSWLVRFRHIYGFSAEETINYLVPGGWMLRIRDLGRLARAEDLPTFLETLPPPYREVLGGATTWERVQGLLGTWFMAELHRAFGHDPFHAGLPISYLLLKEMEVRSLESLLVAAARSEPPEKIQDFIHPPLREVGRV